MTSPVEEGEITFEEFLKELRDNNVTSPSFYTKDTGAGGSESSSDDDGSESSSDDDDSKNYTDDEDLGVVFVDAYADIINGSGQCSEEVDPRNSETPLNVDCSKKRIMSQEDIQCGKRQRKAMMKQETKDEQVQDQVSLLEGKNSEPAMCTDDKLVEDQSCLLEKKNNQLPPDEEEHGKDEKDLRQLEESQRTDKSKDQQQQQPDNVLHKPVLNLSGELFRVDTWGSIKASKGKELGNVVLIEGGYGVTICNENGNLIAAASGVSKPVSVVYHKLEAIRKGMLLAIQLGCVPAIVHTDSGRIIIGLLNGNIYFENKFSSRKYVYSLYPELYDENGNYCKKPTEEFSRDLTQLIKDADKLSHERDFTLSLASRQMLRAAEHISKSFSTLELDYRTVDKKGLWSELEFLAGEAQRFSL